MTIIINLCAGPGAGKTTYASHIFSSLKQKGVNAELVTEWVKTWAWNKRVPSPLDQIYILGKQMQKELAVISKVTHVVTDSPIYLSGYYARKYGTPAMAEAIETIVREYKREMEAAGATFINIILTRKKDYNPAGRYQNEEEARQIDTELVNYVDFLGLPCIFIEGTKEAVDGFIERIKI